MAPFAPCHGDLFRRFFASLLKLSLSLLFCMLLLPSCPPIVTLGSTILYVLCWPGEVPRLFFVATLPNNSRVQRVYTRCDPGRFFSTLSGLPHTSALLVCFHISSSAPSVTPYYGATVCTAGSLCYCSGTLCYKFGTLLQIGSVLAVRCLSICFCFTS